MVLCDVAARDGLQNERRHLSPVVRAELVGRLVDAGLRSIEIGSFVSARRVPQMAGAEAVAAQLPDAAGASYAGLVLNRRGYERLAGTRLAEARFAFAVTERFNIANAGKRVEEGLAEARAVAVAARADGRRAVVTLAAAFGCPYEGRVDRGAVLELAAAVGDACDAVILADTIGVAAPGEVRAMVAAAARLEVPVGVHLHDTRGTGIANAVAALEAGATIVDAAVGGVGGCPFAPGALGNIATEDLVYLLDRDGVDTGIDLDALVRTARWLEGRLEHPLAGRVARAGAWPPADRLAGAGATRPA